MLQSRALVIALIVLLSTTLPEVQSKSFFEQNVRRELLAIPEAIASYFSEAVNKVSPKISQFYLDTVQSPRVTAARQRLAKEATKVRIMLEELNKIFLEKLDHMWYEIILGY